jgi:transcription initiation factor TFIIB
MYSSNTKDPANATVSDFLYAKQQNDIWKCFSTFKEGIFESQSLSSVESSSQSSICPREDTTSTLTDASDFPFELEQDASAELGDDPDETGIVACEDCKTYTLIYQDGQYVCTKCGVMQKRHLSHEAEYRCYADGNGTKGSNPERVGMPTNNLFPESSLGTTIGRRAGENYHIKRMIQYNSWHQMPYKERSLHRIFTKITNQCKQFGLPTIIIERTKELYHTIKDVIMSRGINREALIAASTFFACKDQGVPRSQKEVAQIYGITSTDVNKGIQHFREVWRMAKHNGDEIHDETSNPIDYIDRYCSFLPIQMEVRYLAEFIAMKSIMNNLVNDNTTPSIAAGAVYLACVVCRQPITKKQVAEACKTSEVTISKCYKKLNEYKHSLLPQSIRDHFKDKDWSL